LALAALMIGAVDDLPFIKRIARHPDADRRHDRLAAADSSTDRVDRTAACQFILGLVGLSPGGVAGWRMRRSTSRRWRR
jgi:hypothetical protein